MNSHHFGYKCSYNYVVRNGSFNEDMHQGWNNTGWGEPQAYGQPSWQQPPPISYRYNSNLNAYQFNSYYGPPCSYQQALPYAYEPYPQHNPQPHTQASFCQTPSYDHNPYPPYQQPYEPYEPHIEPPPFQPRHRKEPPPPYYYQDELPPMHANYNTQDESYFQSQSSMEEYSCPSIQEQYDLAYLSKLEQKSRDQLKESMDRL
ncbi:uncharacterized protein DS421_6g187960 [Arachis hypogaea]|nr:uncharacterized protein DS421_6g187960 [Arachis hypogaea]